MQNFISTLKESSFSNPENGIYDLWLMLGISKMLTFGIWNKDGTVKVISYLEIPNLDKLNYIGFSSFLQSKWEVQNGIVITSNRFIISTSCF